MDLKRGIEKAVESLVGELKSLSQEVGEDNSKIKQVASISASNDNTIGSLIAEAMAKVKTKVLLLLKKRRVPKRTLMSVCSSIMST